MAESAVVYLARALAEPPPPAVRTALLLELGRAEADMELPSSFGRPDRRDDRGNTSTMLLLNPPDHTRLRSLVSRAGAAARKVVGRGSKAEETEPKKPVTKKTAAKKTAAKSTTKKTAAKKAAPAKKTAQKSAEKTAPAKKTAAKKTAAKKASKKSTK